MDASVKIEDFARLNDQQKRGLAKLGVKTVLDLLYHFPVRYGDTADIKNISSLEVGQTATVYGKLENLKASKAFLKKIPLSEGTLADDTGKIRAIWFHQPYLAKMLGEGNFVKLTGKISERNGALCMVNPETEKTGRIPIAVGDSLFGKAGPGNMYPVYPESFGITSRWFYYALQKIFKSEILENLADPLPDYLLEKYNLPSIKTAMVWIHSPKNENDSLAARKRFAFEEVFFIQLEKHREKAEWQSNPSFLIEPPAEDVENFIKRFPFEMTPAQRKAIGHIFANFKNGKPMSRLLEGDVGSGKTAVAAAAMYAVTESRPNGQNFGRLQSAYMAPTEILANQHFESFVKYFEHMNISIGLITSSGCKKFPSKVGFTRQKGIGATQISKTQLLKWVANGEIPILVGTHSLIEKKVKFKNLAFAVIDEQHRFGVMQRQKLRKKSSESVPHLLSMTATPIPRTLALTIYGDLDLTLLDQMPVGRKPVITEIVLPNSRKETYEKMRKELREGRQAYIICPRIDEPDPDKELALNAKSVKEEAKRLKKSVFPEYEIGILHGKMKPDEKEKAMLDFKAKKIGILVATSVVEVGVNVPNATVILIEGAERFGLAQLHQLRGRVIRSEHQAYCYVFSDTKTEKTLARLKALKTAKNGFELAEFDLAQRGAGELCGGKQWGVSDIAMEAMKNIKMVEAARIEAKEIFEKKQWVQKFPEMAKKIATKRPLHLE